METAKSYYLIALSKILPNAPSAGVIIEEGKKGYLPYVLVHATVGNRLLTFYRVVDPDDQIQFGRLYLIEIDGMDFDVPEIDFMEIFNNDPCREVLLKKQ